MNKMAKVISYFALMLVVVLCLASCDQLLSGGFSTHDHEYGEWGEDTATCESDGTQTRTCKTCRKEQTRKTGALGHDLVTYRDKEPACTEPGYQNYKKCSRCDKYEGTLIEALGHTMSVWGNSTATCTKSGEEEATCDVCGVKEKRAVEAPGHDIDLYGECRNCHKTDIVVLFEDGKANFNLVVTSKAGGDAMAIADMFIDRLRSLGITMNDTVMDFDTSTVSDCEIIIGTGATGRGDACNITEKELGTEGQMVKIVGNKIIIAGSDDNLTTNAFNRFVEQTLGITSETKSIGYVEVDSDCCYATVKDYIITSIKIAGVDLSQYGYVLDVLSVPSGYPLADVNKFHDDLFALSGYYLNYVASTNMTSSGKYFIVRYVKDAGEEGFRAYMDGDDFVVECAYHNMFNDAFRDFANSNFLFKSGDVSIPADFNYTKTVSVVYYEDFEAVGDGTTCDYEAIYNTHMFANAGGQKVLSKLGANAKYYISAENFTKTIPIKTDVDFCGATFIVNDLGESAYTYRKLALFTLARDYSETIIRDAIKDVPSLDADGNVVLNADGSVKMTTDGIIDDERYQNIKIAVGETDFTWLKSMLNGKSLVKIENKLHKDFIRHGSNQNSGATRRDIFVVNADGTVDPDSAPVFEFDNISTIEIYRADEKPITVQNGNFINICCRTVASTTYTVNGADKDPDNDVVTTYANKFHEYQRGFIVNRSNATIKNVTHKMQDEPDLGWYREGCGYTPDAKHASYGSRHESYPYYGFVFVNHTYNFLLEDTQLCGHTTYYEDKPATASTGWQIPNPVPMGTYDYVLEYADHITFKNVIQVNKETQQDSANKGDYSYLTDTRYWGIMSSNGTKNLTFDGCVINRFDAHRGFWNANIVDTYIGHSFQVIGGGTLYVENVTKAAKSNFMTFRGDYGATFEGDVILKNCVHEARKTHNSWTGSVQAKGSESTVYIMDSGFEVYNYGYSEGEDGYLGGYWYWDFGYTCYMPINVTIDNYKSSAKNNYVYDDLPDILFTSTYEEGKIPDKFTVRNPYQITKTITQMNMSAAIPTCKGTYQRNSHSSYKDYPTYTYTKLKGITVTKKNIG